MRYFLLGVALYWFRFSSRDLHWQSVKYRASKGEKMMVRKDFRTSQSSAFMKKLRYEEQKDRFKTHIKLHTPP